MLPAGHCSKLMHSTGNRMYLTWRQCGCVCVSVGLSQWAWASYHAIDRQQLVSSLQPSLAVGHPPRDHSGDVDRGVLLFPPHDVKTQALLCLGQLYHPWVGVALAGREGCHCGLVREATAWSEKKSLFHVKMVRKEVYVPLTSSYITSFIRSN